MSKLRYTELFYSVQGEGRYIGVPSIFLRTLGCNFRCKNFGRLQEDVPEGETHNPEVKVILQGLDKYKTFKDLPLVNTGCDTYASVYPEFKGYAKTDTTDAIANAIVELLPYKQWKDEHLVITGGEPLLGWQREYPALLDSQLMYSLKELTFETNGTQLLSQNFQGYLLDWTSCRRYRDDLTFSVSPKLSTSGEKWEEAIKPEVIEQMQEIGFTYLKFVIDSEKTADEAMQSYSEYKQLAGFDGPVYFMPVGGTGELYFENNKKVAELAMKYGVRYSPRIQVDLFKNAWGT